MKNNNSINKSSPLSHEYDLSVSPRTEIFRHSSKSVSSANKELGKYIEDLENSFLFWDEAEIDKFIKAIMKDWMNNYKNEKKHTTHVRNFALQKSKEYDNTGSL